MSHFHESSRRTATDRLIGALACFFLLAATPASDCRFSTGPNGLCATFRLDPASADLPVGSTLQIRINDFDCDGSQPCVSCSEPRRRVRWESSAPDVARVDSTGMVRAERAGTAEIRLVVEGATAEPPSARITVNS
jgi:Big-like domain-containing protein